jgi:hypothetical protein
MHGSGTAREARRRPDFDLLIGPLEAGGATDEDDVSQPELIELDDPSELPAWREDG